MEEIGNAIENFGKVQLRRSSHRWENNIKIDLTELWCEGANCIQFTENNIWWQAFVNMIMNFRFHTVMKLLTN
jgi:hypothetical protein